MYTAVRWQQHGIDDLLPANSYIYIRLAVALATYIYGQPTQICQIFMYKLHLVQGGGVSTAVPKKSD